jgi:hypothetical protein
VRWGLASARTARRVPPTTCGVPKLDQALEELTEQIVVRVDPKLHRALKRDAKENGRTVAQTIRFVSLAADRSSLDPSPVWRQHPPARRGAEPYGGSMGASTRNEPLPAPWCGTRQARVRPRSGRPRRPSP